MKLTFHSVEIITEEDGREVLLLGTKVSADVLKFAKVILGEEVEITPTLRPL